jgi:hypothetical protein
MDRIELDEQLEAESLKAPQRLLIPSLSRFQVKQVSNLDHAKKTALCEEISQAFGLPIPRLMKLISVKGYQFCLETFHQVQKAQARNPAALFLWKIKQVKVELTPITPNL